MIDAAQARIVYNGSDKVATRRFCRELQERGQLGNIAAAMFHAQKSSCRAKAYHGGIQCRGGRTLRYAELAYRRKGEFLKRLAELLSQDDCGMTWGWGLDENQSAAKDVLYIDLPHGQVSFHSLERFNGPNYPGQWDGQHASEDRVLAFCDHVQQSSSGTAAAPSMAPFAIEITENPNVPTSDN